MSEVKCCGGVYSGVHGCKSEQLRRDGKKDGLVIFQNVLTGRYYCATCLFAEPELDGYPNCKGTSFSLWAVALNAIRLGRMRE